MMGEVGGVSTLVVPVFQLFRHPDVALMLALAMFAIGSAVALWFSWKVWRAEKTDLGLATKDLRDIPTPEEFCTRFADFDERLSSLPLLAAGWREFTETLVIPLSDETQVIRNTARPSQYLSATHVSNQLRLSWYQALPNYFVGFGLLFTFFGLVAALHFASEGVGGDVRQAQSALKDLLHAATFKFATSIAGLGCSILLSMFFRYRILGMQRHFDKLCNLLEERMTFVTPEGLAIENLREARAQTHQLERFNTDFAVQLGEVLSPGIGNAMEPMAQSVAGMGVAVSDLAARMSSMNQDALQKMLVDFQESIQGAAGTELQALGERLQSLQSGLTELIIDLKNSGGSFGASIEASARTSADVLGAATTALDGSISEIARRFGGTLEGAAEEFGAAISPLTANLHGLDGTLGNMDKCLQAQVTALDAALTGIRRAADGMEGTLAHIAAAGAPIADTAERFGAAAVRVDTALNETANAISEIRSVATTLGESAETVSRTWASYRDRFENVDADIGKTFAAIQQGNAAYTAQVQEYVTQIDRHLAQAVNTLGGGIAELTEAVEALGDRADTMTGEIANEPILA